MCLESETIPKPKAGEIWLIDQMYTMIVGGKIALIITDGSDPNEHGTQYVSCIINNVYVARFLVRWLDRLLFYAA